MIIGIRTRWRAGLSLLLGLAVAWSEAGAADQKKKAVASAVAPAALPKLEFNETIQPILSEYCYHCHGPDPGGRKADLRLDRAEFAYAPHEKSGPAILPGDPAHSPLIQRIESTKEKERMPPPEAHKTLKPEEIALLRRWVAEGAQYQEHWAFIAPTRPSIPVPHGGEVHTPIDALILARLEKEKLSPSPEADRRTLIRRVKLDLTGLPPTPAEIDAFLSDQQPEAYERVVDRLLASPRYGEHRARYWLDYVRYADTHGVHFDNHRAIWPYRDYVIQAFNTNKRFDQFVREQLAGDLLPVRSLDQLIATGFIRSNLTTNEGGTIPEEIHVNQTRDRVETFGGTFLGLTTGCAVCHDHKFDPISQRDTYSLAAFLGNTKEAPWDGNVADPPPVVRLPDEEVQPAAEMLLARRTELQEKLDARRARATQLFTDWLASGHRPMPVAPDQLELRLRFDEGQGDVLKNSAPGAQPASFQADTAPLIWGENSWLWPSVRLEGSSRVSLGSLGNVEANESFSAGGWLMLRRKPGVMNALGQGTGDGAVLARIGATGSRGWEIYYNQESQKFFVRLMAGSPTSSIQISTTHTADPTQWLHLFFTYDGSRNTDGLKLYVNGKLAQTDGKMNSLQASDSIRTEADLYLGRRADGEVLHEARYQDIRFYRRALTAAEVERMPWEEVAAEIVARQPDPTKWTSDERFVALDRYFLGQVDTESKRLATSLTVYDAAFAALTQNGPATLIAREKDTPAYADILKRGDYFSRAERVEPATPHFLPPLSPDEPRNRLGLANWLLTPEQPLFARVTVNRMWQEVFGRGLVESAGDFGIMGARPSHPELLDWLAVEFRENGWDAKSLYRLMVTSAVYRQSNRVTPELLAKDPGNRLLARGPRFRMDGEQLRDSALAASGLLVDKIGGPSVKPYQPPGVWEEVAMPISNTRHYEPDHGESLYRRSLYTFWKRSAPPPSMEVFDASSREAICPRRARSNTPLQALVTLNDPQFVEAARKLAERSMRATPEVEARLDFLACATIGRPLEAREKAVSVRAAATYQAHYAEHPADAQALLGVGEAPVDPTMDPAQLASWTLVASQFFNLDEFVTK